MKRWLQEVACLALGLFAVAVYFATKAADDDEDVYWTNDRAGKPAPPI